MPCCRWWPWYWCCRRLSFSFAITYVIFAIIAYMPLSFAAFAISLIRFHMMVDADVDTLPAGSFFTLFFFFSQVVVLPATGAAAFLILIHDITLAIRLRHAIFALMIMMPFFLPLLFSAIIFILRASCLLSFIEDTPADAHVICCHAEVRRAASQDYLSEETHRLPHYAGDDSHTLYS